MNAVQAPPPGWYPDPAGGVRLRWWDGTDWSDRFRSRPAPSEGYIPPGRRLPVPPVPPGPGGAVPPVPRFDTEQVVAQVREAARAEVDRATTMFATRTQEAVRRYEPLVSAYTNEALRWLKVGVIVAVAVAVLWLVLQVVAQRELWDWIGDQVKDLTEEP